MRSCMDGRLVARAMMMADVNPDGEAARKQQEKDYGKRKECTCSAVRGLQGDKLQLQHMPVGALRAEEDANRVA